MKFLHVSFGFHEKPVDIGTIQKVFGDSAWARYAANCWIVYTDEPPKSLAEKLRPLCSTSDTIFICEINMSNRYGYVQKEIWDWIDKLSNRQT
jgi:hypothetical protein